MAPLAWSPRLELGVRAATAIVWENLLKPATSEAIVVSRAILAVTGRHV